MTQTALLHNIAAYDYALTTMTVTSIMVDSLTVYRRIIRQLITRRQSLQGRLDSKAIRLKNIETVSCPCNTCF